MVTTEHVFVFFVLSRRSNSELRTPSNQLIAAFVFQLGEWLCEKGRDHSSALPQAGGGGSRSTSDDRPSL